jgi:aconitase A
MVILYLPPFSHSSDPLPSPLSCSNFRKQLVVKPASGKPSFEVVVNHTFNEEQIEWFKAGSALNLMRRKLSG